MAEVILDNIVKKYDKAVVVHGVSATFMDGEFVVIVGPSGCGKSTVLRMIAGLEEISAGNILISNEIVNHIEPKDRKIAMVFQNYALYPHMTVFNNMAYGLKLRKHKKEEIKQRVNEAAEMLQLEEFLHRKPRQLSGGQRQRVAMGRALVRKPGVFLFDEPLSNLDAKLRHQMRVELKRLHNQLGTTMIYVTHDQVEAMTLADRIVVLNDGIIEQIGTPDQIYGKPVSTFVAGFIGSPPMNFLNGVVENETQLRLSSGETIALQKSELKPGKITLGIRPEKVTLLTHKVEDALQINIDFVEKLGAGQLLYSHIGEDTFVTSLQNGLDFSRSECWAKIAEEDIHLFDSETGKSLTFS